jgi:dephospho-CoA kinase
MYIAVTGTIASGKGEVVKILKRRGFMHYGFGNLLRSELMKAGIEHTIENTRAYANKKRAEHGPDYFAKRLLNEFERDMPKNAVFESVRTLGELKTLKTLPRLILIAVDAPRELRFERLLARGRTDGITTFEEFCAAEDAQLEGKAHEQHILDVMDQADVKVVNIGNLEELDNQIQDALGL